MDLPPEATLRMPPIEVCGVISRQRNRDRVPLALQDDREGP